MQRALESAIAASTEVTLRPSLAESVMNAARLAVYVETMMSSTKPRKIWKTLDAAVSGYSKPPQRKPAAYS